MKILLGLTGSVATTIAPKIIAALRNGIAKGLGVEARIVCLMTDKAQHFYRADDLRRQGVEVLLDDDEWPMAVATSIDTEEDDIIVKGIWKKNDPVPHVELGRDAAALVIAPATLNTLGKMANGICDNLLLSTYFAMPNTRPVIVAGAMNTNMWHSQANQDNIDILKKRNVIIVHPVEKELACGDVGMGAMADAKDIANAVACALQWRWPLEDGVCPGIPVGRHLGAFGAFRKHGKRHCGVDLYARKGSLVHPVEEGRVVAIDWFTGEKAGSPWWNNTMAVKVEGSSGVVCYGEIEPLPLAIGDYVSPANPIGAVAQVLMDGQLRTDIPGHSLSMLHLQLYAHGMIHKDESWMDNDPRPLGVFDPTPYLLHAAMRGDLPELDMP